MTAEKTPHASIESSVFLITLAKHHI